MSCLGPLLWFWMWATPGEAGAIGQSQPPLPADPTPLIELITAQERKRLADAKNPRKLVEVHLKISDAHLDLALKGIEAGDHRIAERELDIYNKAVAEAANVAFSARDNRRKMAKMIEQRLLKQIKVLESVERRFPAERLRFAEAALDHARTLRVRAINEAFAGGEVLKSPSSRRKPSNGQTAGGSGQWSVVSGQRGARRLVVAGGGNSAAPLTSNLRPLTPSRQIPGDYLNEEEDDHVRQAQQIDERAKVFMKIADRRLAAMNQASAQPLDKKAQKKAEQEAREWGEVPRVSRVELLLHYARAVEECIAKLEDAHERNPKSSAIPKALRILLDATDRHLQLLHRLESELTEESEVAALRRALDQAKTANEGAREGLKG